ncbi:MAG: SPOR domain-containing protein [Porticoccaceae bacterium]|nr:SPOR domain-containing protein [Porticoccaceae bacterium]
MAKDYANKSPKKRKPAARNKARKPVVKASPRWPWMLGGFVLGILTMVLIQRWENPQQDIAQTIDGIVGNEDTQSIKPRFDFYTLLPESEVTIPNTEQSPVRGSQKNGDIFMLQAGSFRNTTDADGLRARLLLLNLDAHVEAATSQSAGTWHRVIVGPFKSRSKLANARATLLQNGIDNLVLKGKEGG